MPDDFAAEETSNPIVADARGYFKVERWTKDGLHIERMIYAGNRIDKAREIFEEVVRHRPGGHYLIRQGARVLEKSRTVALAGCCTRS